MINKWQKALSRGGEIRNLLDKGALVKATGYLSRGFFRVPLDPPRATAGMAPTIDWGRWSWWGAMDTVGLPLLSIIAVCIYIFM